MTVELSLGVDELFGDDGELRLWNDADGWAGFVLEEGLFYYVDTRREEDDPYSRMRVGKSAVRDAIRRRLTGSGPIQFSRRIAP